mgnify:CR=1 FL=1
MPASTEILAPVTALLLLTCVVWAWMYITRIPAISKAGMKLDPNLPKGQQMSELPPRVRWKADNYNHLLEQPTLFYAVALTLALLAARTPQDIVAALALHLREGFAVPHHALRAWNLAADSVPGLTDPVSPAVRESVAAMAQPVCGALAVNDAEDWFGEVSPHLRAFACIPLRPAPAAASVGLLVLASEEAKRFYAGMGTLYLERLGQLVGAALVRMQG